MTRLLVKSDDAETAAALVAERRAMREALHGLRRQVAGVGDIQSRRR